MSWLPAFTEDYTKAKLQGKKTQTGKKNCKNPDN